MTTESNPVMAEQPCVVLDGVFFQFRDRSGIGRVWSSLLEEWSGTTFGQSLVVLDRDGAVPKFPGISYLPFQNYYSGLAASESFALEDVCRRYHAKLFISTFHTTPLETASVAMVHDLIPERCPSIEPKKWRQEKRFTTYHARGYVAVSHRTAQDLHEVYPTTKDAPFCIAHNGVSTRFCPVPSEVVQRFKKTYGITKPYFLCVGRRNAHKNGRLFFDAFSRLPDRIGLSIVCCGVQQTLEPESRTCVEGNEVHMLNLPDEDLNAAYAGALALVYPSKYEGFGLPIVEAMAAGCPVITCRNGSIPEIAGAAVLYVDDSDVAGMVRALIDIRNSDIRDPLIQAGFQRCRLFSWSNTAQIVGSFLTEMARRDHSLPEVGRPDSSRCWRELRSVERQFDSTSPRLQELLQVPELQRHMRQLDGTSRTLEELESIWLESIAEENGKFYQGAGKSA